MCVAVCVSVNGCIRTQTTKQRGPCLKYARNSTRVYAKICTKTASRMFSSIIKNSSSPKCFWRTRTASIASHSKCESKCKSVFVYVCECLCVCECVCVCVCLRHSATVHHSSAVIDVAPCALHIISPVAPITMSESSPSHPQHPSMDLSRKHPGVWGTPFFSCQGATQCKHLCCILRPVTIASTYNVQLFSRRVANIYQVF